MRARERSAVERRLAALVPGVRVVWARRLPEDEAWAMLLEDQRATATAIVIDEASFSRASAADRLDTIVHEAAHLLAWQKHGREIANHGPEWRRIYRALRRDHGL